MANGTIGATMRQKYEDMIMERFLDAIEAEKTRLLKLKEAIEVEVKKDLGIYDLMVERAKLQARLEEIEEKTKEYTEENYIMPSSA